MKFATALLLCGLSCALASPSCDESEANKCAASSTGLENGKTYPEVEAQLDTFCSAGLSELDCQLEFTERCPHTLLGASRLGLLQYRETFGKFCDKGTPLRQKFLEKGPCLNAEELSAFERCSEIVTENDYCKKVVAELKCAEEELNRVCGSDGQEVYAELHKSKKSVQNTFCNWE